jgi:GntR family transcriptional regulator
VPGAKWPQVAADLETGIENGRYPWGTTLPTEENLARAYDVSRDTIRRALADLRTRGLIRSVRRKGTIVAPRPTRVSIRRYVRMLRPGSDRGPWERACHEQGIAGRTEVVEVAPDLPAPAPVARALGLAEGTPVIYRRRRMWASDKVRQVQHSWTPGDIAAHTKIANTAKLIGGFYAALVAIGRPPSEVTERVTARQPTRTEAHELSMQPGAPVLVIERITYDHCGRAVELLHTIADADHCELVYERMPVQVE